MKIQMCLLYFSTIIANNNSQRKCLLLMQYPPSAQTAISIPKTIESLPSTVVSSVLAAHVLSGCDKVPQLFGIGKKKVIRLLKGQDNNTNGIEQLGNIDPDIPWDNTERGCISFICGRSGNSGNKTLAEMRYSNGWRRVNPTL